MVFPAGSGAVGKFSQAVDGGDVISFIGVGDNLIHDVIFEEAHMDDGTFNFKSMFENVADEIEQADLAKERYSIFKGKNRAAACFDDSRGWDLIESASAADKLSLAGSSSALG